MNIEGNKLMPGNGYKYVTNSKAYSTLVFLGKYDSVDNWHDTNDEPPEIEEDVEADISDYEAALGRFGV